MPMSDKSAICGRDGCERKSEYLLTCGDRCREHAEEDQPETVRYIDIAGGQILNGAND